MSNGAAGGGAAAAAGGGSGLNGLLPGEPANTGYNSNGERGRGAPPGTPVAGAPAPVALDIPAMLARVPARCEPTPCKPAMRSVFVRSIYKIVDNGGERDAAIEELGGLLDAFRTSTAASARFSMLGDQTLELAVETSDKGALDTLLAAAGALGWFVPKKIVMFGETRDQRIFHDPWGAGGSKLKQKVPTMAGRNAQWRANVAMAEFLGTVNTTGPHGAHTERGEPEGGVPTVGELTAMSPLYDSLKAWALRPRGTINTPSLRAQAAQGMAATVFTPANIIKSYGIRHGVASSEIVKLLKGPKTAEAVGALFKNLYGPLPVGWTEENRMHNAHAAFATALSGTPAAGLKDKLWLFATQGWRTEGVPAPRNNWSADESSIGKRGGARRKTRRRRSKRSGKTRRHK